MPVLEVFLEEDFFLEPLEDPPLVEFEEGLSVSVLSVDLCGFLEEDFFSPLPSSSILLEPLEDPSLVKLDGACSSKKSMVTSSLSVGAFSGVCGKILSATTPAAQEITLSAFEDPESGVLKDDNNLVGVALGKVAIGV